MLSWKYKKMVIFAYIACQNCVKVEDAKAMPFKLHLAKNKVVQ